MKKLLGTSVMLLLMAFIGVAPAGAEVFYWNQTVSGGYVDDVNNWLVDGGIPSVYPGDDSVKDDVVYFNTSDMASITSAHTFGGAVNELYVGKDGNAGSVEQTSGDVSFLKFEIGKNNPGLGTSYYYLKGGTLTQYSNNNFFTIGQDGGSAEMEVSGGNAFTPGALFQAASGSNIRVGIGGATGKLTITDYGVATLGNLLKLGYNANSNGTISMKEHGQLSIGEASTTSYIGRDANTIGKLEMIGDSQATLEGAIKIGHAGGNGTISLDGSAKLTLGTAGVTSTLGTSSDSIGKLEMDGDSSEATVYGNMFIVGSDGTAGHLATGTIELKGHSKLTVPQFNLSNNNYSNSAVTVTDYATLSSTGSLFVGVAGASSTSSLTVSLNGTVDTDTHKLTIGRGGSTGTLTISDTAEVIVGSGDVRFADDGTATINLDGGTLVCDYIHTDDGVDGSVSTATFNFNGGTLKANDSNEDFIVVGTSYATQSLNVLAGGAVIDTNTFDMGINQALLDGVVLGTDGGLTKNGDGILTLGAANTYTGATAVNAGGLYLSTTGSITSNVTVDAAASLGGDGTITGDVDLYGTLAVAYDSDADTIDLLTVVGDLNLNTGTISLSDVGSGTLADGAYVFATYDNLLGDPDTEVTVVGLETGWSIDYAYGGNSIALLVSGSPLPGDANHDGKVDAADVSIMAANWGATGATWEMGNFSSDNDTVGPDDAKIIAQNWGTGGNESTSAVPEPGSLALLMGIMVSIFACGRRQRLRG